MCHIQQEPSLFMAACDQAGFCRFYERRWDISHCWVWRLHLSFYNHGNTLDMAEVSEQQPAKPSDADKRALTALQREIDNYQRDEQNESLLGKAVGKLTHVFWHKD